MHSNQTHIPEKKNQTFIAIQKYHLKLIYNIQQHSVIKSNIGHGLIYFVLRSNIL